MSLDFTDDQPALVQVMAWCRQATSHYLSYCWPRSMSPYGITRPQWVNPCYQGCLFIFINRYLHYLSFLGTQTVNALSFENLPARISSLATFKQEKEGKLAGPTHVWPAKGLRQRLLKWCRQLKLFPVEDRDLFILYNQYRCCDDLVT